MKVVPARSLLLAAAGLTGLLASCGDRPSRQAPSREITTPSGVEMVLIPGGAFDMGSDREIDARPVHKVLISSFYMDKCEVTQERYEKVMGTNPSRTKGAANPVERTRWTDAIKYCNALSEKEGLNPCYDLKTGRCNFDADGYRLPTEAEWEYSCRAGTKGDYYFGSDAGKLQTHAWFKANAAGKPHPVGQKRPNAFGLHDMSGNVREWCNDWYQVDYYKQGAASAAGTDQDPQGPPAGEKKVLRGGAWSASDESCCSWSRYCDDPGFSDACVVQDDCGFRCVRRAAKSETEQR